MFAKNIVSIRLNLIINFLVIKLDEQVFINLHNITIVNVKLIFISTSKILFFTRFVKCL